MNIAIIHVINLATWDNKFKTLVEYVEYKLFKRVLLTSFNYLKVIKSLTGFNYFSVVKSLTTFQLSFIIENIIFNCKFFFTT